MCFAVVNGSHGKHAIQRNMLNARMQLQHNCNNKWNAVCYTMELLLMMIHVTKETDHWSLFSSWFQITALQAIFLMRQVS